MLRDGCIDGASKGCLGVGPAWHTPWISNSKIDLVVTSPPFADVVDYAQENWMRAWFAGIDTQDIDFAHHASLPQWSKMIRKTLVETMRVVKPGGFISLEVGEIRGGTVKLERLVWEAAKGLPCKRLGVIVHDQAFTKSAHIFNVTNGNRGTNSNRIVILQRN